MADPFFKDLAFAALAQTARNPTRDFLQATPRNPILGYLSDLAASSYSPERTQQMQGVAKFMSAPAISETLDRLSYGQPLTTGAGGLGGTTRVRPEALEAAMAVAPTVVPALNMIRPAVKAGARALGPTAVSMGEGYLQRQGLMPGVVEGESAGMRGGMGAEMLQGMGRGTVSPVKEKNLYHGTKGDIFQSFDNDASNNLIGGTWLTEEKPYAQWIADHNEKGSVLTVKSKASNPMIFDVFEEGKKVADEIGIPIPENALEAQEILSGGMGWNTVVRDLVNEAKSKGHDSLKITSFNDAYHSNPKDVTTAHIVFDPSNLQIIERNGQPAVQQAMNEFEQSLINFMATPAK